MPCRHEQEVEDSSAVWRDSVFEEYSRRKLVCSLAKSGQLCTPVRKRSTSVSVCVCMFALPDGSYLSESDGQASWRGTPIV